MLTITIQIMYNCIQLVLIIKMKTLIISLIKNYIKKEKENGFF